MVKPSDEEIRRRILVALSKQAGPVKPRVIQMAVSRGIQADDFWRVLESSVRAGDVWSENGMLTLNGTQAIPSPRRGSRELPESASLAIERRAP